MSELPSRRDPSAAGAAPLIVTRENPYGRPAGDEILAVGEISIPRLLRVLRVQWRVIAFSIVVCALLATGYLLTATRQYRAECIVEMSLMRPRIMSQRGAVIDDTDTRFERSEDVLSTRLEKLRGRSVLEKAIQTVAAQVAVVPASGDELEQLMRESVLMRIIRNTRLLQITFEHSDRDFAAAAANAFAEAAAAVVAEENKTASDSAVAWLEDQAVLQREALERADLALLEFDKEFHIDQLEREKNRLEDSLKSFGEVLTQLDSQQSLANDLYKSLVALESVPADSRKLTASIPRAKEIESLVEQLVQAVSKRDELRTRYTPKHPEIVAQDAVIESLLRRAKEAVGANLDLLRQQGESLRRSIDEQGKQAMELEQKILERATKRTALERTRDASDISYKGILTRIQEARLSADERTATVKVIETARAPRKPVRPQKLLIVALALFAGCTVGVALAFYADALADFVANLSDIERDIGLKMLGVIPHVNDADNHNTALASMEAVESPAAEAVAGLRGLLDAPQYEARSHSVLVTSTAPGEGKTMLACNIAVASARSGRRTLLIDLDLRRPRVAAIFGLTGDGPDVKRMLTDADAIALQTMPEKTSCPGLDVLATRHSISLSASQIVGGRAVRVLLEWAHSSYDRVIIDSPPFGLVSDSAVLAGMAGCVIMVCRPGSTRKRAVQFAARHFHDIGANIIGIVVNDVDMERQALLSNFGYYGHYGHYGTPDDAQDKPSGSGRRTGGVLKRLLGAGPRNGR